MHIALLLVVRINISVYILSPATERQKRQWLCLIFNHNVPATLPVSLYVCANHFSSDCFSNEGQQKAGLASTPPL